MDGLVGTRLHRLGVVALGGLLGLLMIEAIVRGSEWWSLAGRPDVQRLHAQYKRIYSDERDQPYVFGHQRNVRVTLTHGPYTYTMVTNSEGLREAQDYGSLSQSVVFLGDSIVEGASVENRDTMDSVFEELTGVVALNFGLGSGNTIQEYEWLVHRYKPSYHAKVIVLGFCLNDFEQNTYLRAFDPQVGTWVLFKTVEPESHRSTSGTPSLRERLGESLKASRALYTLYRMLRARTVGFPDWWSARRVKDDERMVTETYLLKLQTFASSIGAKLLVVVFPQESQLKRAYRPGERMQDVLIELCTRHHVPYLDLYQPLKEASERQPKADWYYDDTHPFTPGHRLIGTVLAERIPRIFPGLLRTRAQP